MEIPFNFTHVFSRGSSPRDNAYALRSLLDCLININLAYLRHYSVPSLYRSGVVYGRTKVWEPIPELYARQFGDCKSLSAALIAQYQMKGIEASPVFRFADNQFGGKDFHILVMVSEKSFLGKPKIFFTDPSRKLGMGSNECARFYRDSEYNLR